MKLNMYFSLLFSVVGVRETKQSTARLQQSSNLPVQQIQNKTCRHFGIEVS